jgi:hypothetical protein
MDRRVGVERVEVGEEFGLGDVGGEDGSAAVFCFLAT